MPRNEEVKRQWKILREIEASRLGKTLEQLAEIGKVHTRTIRRDLEALQEAGFTLYDEPTEGGRKTWKLKSKPFRDLETSFNVTEIAALYFSRTLLESALPEPFSGHLKAAFDRLDSALSPHMRQFLSQLPDVITAKHNEGAPRRSDVSPEMVSRLTAAALGRRKIVITYHSFSSRRIKEYQIEPYLIVYGDGSLYLYAFVPAYGQMRTFALRRIKKFSVLEETFEAVQQVPTEPFVNSLGINVGNPEHVEIEFMPQVADYVKERSWHQSQTVTPRPDGSVLLELNVCLDWALTRFILGFGPFARVIAPPALAERILEELEEAREVYVPRLAFAGDHSEPGPAPSLNRLLPFPGDRPRKRKPA